MNATKLHLRDVISLDDYACMNALNGRFALAGSRSVSPVIAPSTGGVRPQAGNSILMVTRLVDEAKADVRVRNLGPPI
ncbi:hypothetical protein [Phytoactinopolyspora halotolerans]|uniref:Uncharacterized protein n=1 Tax=Phytoactinopolyspora halotolerans TaxID=1981512 RepID=A0A6L9SGC0_9ACTN|nr:hypothetical protein [Phytoactinopolyspora halotolerans]NEE04137.1 hypothetical protein [Phytoactinopolyspora halotolerans]